MPPTFSSKALSKILEKIGRCPLPLTDIYEAAGVSRRTNDQVEGVVGKCTNKGDAAVLAGWSDNFG